MVLHSFYLSRRRNENLAGLGEAKWVMTPEEESKCLDWIMSPEAQSDWRLPQRVPLPTFSECTLPAFTEETVLAQLKK